MYRLHIIILQFTYKGEKNLELIMSLCDSCDWIILIDELLTLTTNELIATALLFNNRRDFKGIEIFKQ